MKTTARPMARPVSARGLAIAFAVCGLAGVAGFAQAQSDSPSPCASITDDKSRLQCYDAEQALRKSQSGARPSTPASPPAAAPATVPAPSPPPASAAVPAPAASTPAPSAAREPAPAPKAAEAAPPESASTSASGSADTGFGSETLRRKSKPGESEGASEITAKVASVSGKRKGDYRITLDNGQVWAETQRTGGEPPQPGDTVILRRGALGSYFLSKGNGLALRVTRVK